MPGKRHKPTRRRGSAIERAKADGEVQLAWRTCERCGGPITLVRVCEACVPRDGERGTGEKP